MKSSDARMSAQSEATVRIRPARAEDLERVVALLSDDFLGATRESANSDLAPYIEAFADIEADPRNMVYVAEQGGRILGCYQLTIIPNLTFGGGRRALIEGVRVAESSRGSGIGRRMIEHAVDIARAEQCRIVQLTSNKKREDTLRFYEKLGFEPSHIGFKLYL